MYKRNDNAVNAFISYADSQHQCTEDTSRSCPLSSLTSFHQAVAVSRTMLTSVTIAGKWHAVQFAAPLADSCSRCTCHTLRNLLHRSIGLSLCSFTTSLPLLVTVALHLAASTAYISRSMLKLCTVLPADTIILSDRSANSASTSCIVTPASSPSRTM